MLDFGFYNMDCLEGMKKFPDNYFDLAIVDPPYGGAITADNKKNFIGKNGCFGGRFDKYFLNYEEHKELRHYRSRNAKYVERTGGTWASKYGTGIKNWDIAPSDEYFKELFRVSKNQIIWGGITSYYLLQGAFLFGKS